MSNNKQSSVEWQFEQLSNSFETLLNTRISFDEYFERNLEIRKQAKAMQKQQAEHYATFITNCVNNNLPTITFNDWINLENQ